jgi:4-amino-4-deoxy-L-arabinose transferase-like glycosyltransferase
MPSLPFSPLPPSDEARAARLALALLAAGLLARLGLAVLVDPGLDEAYAMAVTRVVQVSWFDHPPMAFWWVWGMRALAAPLFGPEVPAAVLRLPFVLAFTATSWLLFDLTRRLWGARAGLWTLVALTLAPFFLVSAGSWLVPDGPLVLFLALTARLLVEILWGAPDPRRERRLWIGVGLALGLAGLSKYHAALFAIGAFAFFLATPHRRRLTTLGPWIAVGLAVVVASPAILWNAANGWVSFLFQSKRGGGRGGLSLVGFGRAILGQAAYLGPWTLVGAAIATVRIHRIDRTLAGPAAFLTAIAAPSILIFTLVPLFGGDGLPHWQMPGWLFLLPLLGRTLAETEAATARLARGFAWVAIGLLALAAALVGTIRVVPPSPETVARLKIGGFLEESLSWRGLSEELAARGLLAPGPGGAPAGVVALRWIEAARLGEALGSRATVMVFDRDPRGFAFQSDPAAFVGRDLVVIGRPQTFARGLDALRPLFDRIEEIPPIPVRLGDGTLFTARAAIGHRLLAPYPLPYPNRERK